MSQVGERERLTQNRTINFFQKKLHWQYLGNWKDREGNSNIEEHHLRSFLKDRQGYAEDLIRKAIFELKRATGDQTKSLYEVNKDVYSLLRYGVKVRESQGDHKQTVWLIDWEHPLNNKFAIAEEVTVEGEHTKRS